MLGGRPDLEDPLMRNPQVVIAVNAEELASMAAKCFVSTATESVARRGRFAVAISGGSTPREMHQMLAAPPALAAIPWAKVHLFWVDERCVPADDPRSNFGTARKDFLSQVPIPEKNLHPMQGEFPSERGAEDYELELIRFFHLEEGEFPVFDLVFLGMGADGHTASLFPGDGALHEGKRRVVAVRGGIPVLTRITMTLPVFNRARRIVFLAVGREKAETVKAVMSGHIPALPAGMIRPLEGELLWLLDQAAASRLERG
jgi:6-phosphogluconolactonase